MERKRKIKRHKKEKKLYPVRLQYNMYPTHRTEAVEAFVFGIAYAIGALGCLFPLFLVIATHTLAAPTAWLRGSYFGAYFVGISGMMFAVILLSTFAKDLFIKYLQKILSHMERITGGDLSFRCPMAVN